MRLAQIARKVQTTPKEIIKYIEQNFEAVISSAPNTKIPEEYVQNILDHFEQSIEKKEEKPASIVPPIEKSPLESQSKEKKEPKSPSPSPEKDIASTTSETNPTEPLLEEDKDVDEIEREPLNIEDGVIKAPKVEVQGIKVVDKIELPTKKEEEETEKEEDEEILSTEKESEKATPKEKSDNKAKKPPKKKKLAKKQNTTTYEEQLKKDNAAYEKKLKEKREKEKQKKKSHYEKMMKERMKNQKHPHSKKDKSNIDKSRNEKQNSANQKEEKPKTAWGKFIKWLNT